MAIDPKLVSIKTAGELPVSDPSDNANFLFYEGDTLQRSPMSNIYDKVTSGIKGVATTITIPSATEFERWLVHEAGTYTNFSGIVVTEADLDIVNGVANNRVFLEVQDGVATKRVERVQSDLIPTGKVEDGNTQAVSGGEVYNSISGIENTSLSYKYTGNSNARVFTELVKNIFIKSTYSDISVEYIGINDQNWRNFLIMLKSDEKLASFIITSDDLRELKNNTVELLWKEEDAEFINNTRIWVEFNDIDFPTISEVSFLESNPNIEFYPLAFDYTPETKTFKYSVNKIDNSDLLGFYNIIENIYIVSTDKSLTKDNFTFNSAYINQNSGVRKLVLFFQKGAKNYIFFTEKSIVSGSKGVKMEFKENDAIQGYDVYVDFKNFDTYPSSYLNIQGQVIKLTDESFTNQELLNKQSIELIESSGIVLKTTTINVSKEADGNNAVQNALIAITDNTPTNRYKIKPAKGIYEVKSAVDYLGFSNSFISPKSHVDIEGSSKSDTIFYADLSNSPGATASDFQVMFNYVTDLTISNITLIAKNIRYALHQDNPNETDGTRYYKNVDFIFLGNQGYLRALGIGTYSGSKTYVEGGKSESQNFPTFTIHNNINFAKPSLWSFKNHSFVTLYESKIITLYNSGSNQDCTVFLENCSFSGNSIVTYEEYWLYSQNVNDHFNHANWRLTGAGNQPFYFKNTVKGSTLCIETLAKNRDAKVRFDGDTSAYPLIIKNRTNYFGNLGNPNRKIRDGYVIQDGAEGIAGFAFGGLSILEFYEFEQIEGNDSLGKRLGDCSTVNKQLGIEINGNYYTVVFNKNYTTFTNAQILAEINTVIGSVATAKEYNIGADYYAEMTDVVSIEVNASSNTLIPKGTLVSKSGSRVKICEDGEEIYGLAIDDIAQYELDNSGVTVCKGRVIKNCYVSLESGNVSSVLNSGNGSRYKVSGGKFVADANGSYILEENKYILIDLKGASGDNLILEYVHSGNKEASISSIDYTTNTFTSVGHGFANNQRVCFLVDLDVAFPSLVLPISNGLPNNGFNYYYIMNVTQNTFQLSTSSGGSLFVLNNKPTVDFSKFKIEQALPSLSITNLPSNLTDVKVEIFGKSNRAGNNIYINPSGISLSNWISGTGINSMTASGGTVFINGVYEFSIKNNICQTKQDIYVVTSTNDTANSAVLRQQSYVKNAGGIQFITGINIETSAIPNGFIIRIYKK